MASLKTKILKRVAAAAATGIVISILFNLFLPAGTLWIGLVSTAFLASVCAFLLFSACAHGDVHGRTILVISALAVVLRLCVGLALTVLLPDVGFDEPVQNSGYVFYDAFKRDNQAWDLGSSGAPLWQAFTEEFTTDQYGGLLSSSALIYRTFSSDAHRSFLILLLGAFMAAIGVPFLYRAIAPRWGSRVAYLACGIYAFYPEAVLLGASQMREPFLMGLSAIAFWAVAAWPNGNRKNNIIYFAVSLISIAFLSSRVAIPVFVILAGGWWLENFSHLVSQNKRWLGWALIGIFFVVLIGFTWSWFRTSTNYDARITEINSGWVKKVIDEFGSQWRIPFILGYGLTQPVLPAAIADVTLPIWQTIAILRALGWYILAPFVIYSAWTGWKIKEKPERWLLAWISAVVLIWIGVASARAGGDQWDNPRYRAILLVWMAFLAAWGFWRGWQTKDRWLARWLLVEVIFVGFFTNWYFSRYFQIWQRMFFRTMIIWVFSLSALVIFGGLAWDLWKSRSR